MVVNRWYPSSNICSRCGYKMLSMPHSVREWTCPASSGGRLVLEILRSRDS
ncbi:MAG: hypothetical protein C7B46_01915 [Sulfobacillus benefaciens]|uniref:Cas12f1-like TNB domain-containing protein n=1 Tax=Sulfobacillus benefaciens TaxID=453960 RepID=A0A2T2XL22_9FIRM|nr:MAG: hypothetical protein C7B46_01915 [Sulfobacillus benefaciens]